MVNVAGLSQVGSSIVNDKRLKYLYNTIKIIKDDVKERCNYILIKVIRLLNYIMTAIVVYEIASELIFDSIGNSKIIMHLVVLLLLVLSDAFINYRRYHIGILHKYDFTECLYEISNQLAKFMLIILLILLFAVLMKFSLNIYNYS